MRLSVAMTLFAQMHRCDAIDQRSLATFDGLAEAVGCEDFLHALGRVAKA